MKRSLLVTCVLCAEGSCPPNLNVEALTFNAIVFGEKVCDEMIKVKSSPKHGALN